MEELKFGSRQSGGITNTGYKYIMINGSAKLEHREIMSRIIGRQLIRQETVHHKNRNRSDNRPENLELLLNKDHVRIHSTKGPIKRICIICGSVFDLSRSRKATVCTCSTVCMIKARNKTRQASKKKNHDSQTN
jgi:hypothetical protein